MTDLSGKVFVVVGASGGLGSRLAHRLAEARASLTLTARSADSLLSGTHTIEADLREPDAGHRIIDGARAHHGRIDGVVIAAGVTAFGPQAEIDDDTVDDLVLVDFLGPLRVLRAALPVVKPGGVIAGISAVLAEQPVGGMAGWRDGDMLRGQGCSVRAVHRDGEGGPAQQVPRPGHPPAPHRDRTGGPSHRRRGPPDAHGRQPGRRGRPHRGGTGR